MDPKTVDWQMKLNLNAALLLNHQTFKIKELTVRKSLRNTKLNTRRNSLHEGGRNAGKRKTEGLNTLGVTRKQELGLMGPDETGRKAN